MFLVLPLLLMQPPAVLPEAKVPVELQWKAVGACPVIRTTLGHGTGVVVGKKDDAVYVLTAAHVVPFDGAGVEFYTRESWPKPAWRAVDAKVVQKWEENIDLALLRCQVGDNVPELLPLAAPGRRPREFPATAYSVGADKGIAPTFESDTLLAKRLVRSASDPAQVAFFWETAQPSRPGRSGGPLLDANGNVIGICAARQGGRGYYVHLDEIQAALKRNNGEYSWLIPAR